MTRNVSICCLDMCLRNHLFPLHHHPPLGNHKCPFFSEPNILIITKSHDSWHAICRIHGWITDAQNLFHAPRRPETCPTRHFYRSPISSLTETRTTGTCHCLLQVLACPQDLAACWWRKANYTWRKKGVSKSGTNIVRNSWCGLKSFIVNSVQCLMNYPFINFITTIAFNILSLLLKLNLCISISAWIIAGW